LNFSTPPALRPWLFNRNIWLMMGNTLFIQASLAINGLIFNLYLSSLGLREDYVGFFSFANTLGIGVFAFPASYLSNRIGPRNCLMLGSLTMALSAAGVALVTNPIVLVAMGGLLGASCALIFVPGGPFLMENTDGDGRMRVFSLNFAIISLAAVLGSLAGYLPPLFERFFAAGPGQATEAYRVVLMISALCCLAGAAPMLLARKSQPARFGAAAPRPSVTPLTEPQARRLLPVLAVAVSVLAFATGLYLPFYNVYLKEHLGVPVESVGLIFAIGSFLMIPTSLLGPAMVRRFGTVGAIVIPRFITAPFLVLAVLSPTVAAGASVYFARSALMTMTWPIDNAFTLELVPPRLRATIGAVRSASWNTSWAVASLVAGQLIVGFGYWIVFALSAALTVAGTVYYIRQLGGYARRSTARTAEAEA
jgi:MFS family permease